LVIDKNDEYNKVQNVHSGYSSAKFTQNSALNPIHEK